MTTPSQIIPLGKRKSKKLTKDVKKQAFFIKKKLPLPRILDRLGLDYLEDHIFKDLLEPRKRTIHPELERRVKILHKRLVLGKEDVRDKRLSRALLNLNKIFSQRDLAKKLNISRNTIAKYKRIKWQRPLEEKKRKGIIAFYRKFLRDRKNWNTFDFYIENKYVRRSKRTTQEKIESLIKEIGEDKLAKRLKVSVHTIRRYKSGRFKKLKHKRYLDIKKVLGEEFGEWEGLFFLTDFTRTHTSYAWILYLGGFTGTIESFKECARKRASTFIENSLVDKRGKFKAEEAKKFIKHLEQVDESKYEISLQNVKKFLRVNFKSINIKNWGLDE